MLAPEVLANSAPSQIDARVVFLTHYIPLYQVRVFQYLTRHIRDFQILLSTPIEPNREFSPDWAGLNVQVQNTWTFRQKWKHRVGGTGFDDRLYVHFPRDTGKRLRRLRPDVVMSMELGARSMSSIRYCKTHPESKLMLCTYMSEHTESSRGRVRSWLRRWMVRNTHALTYNGPSCKRYLESLGVPGDRLFHLPYAADDRTLFSGPTDSHDDTRNKLLCVGQLSDRKGVMPLLEQLSLYCSRRPTRQVEIQFAGNGPLHDSIRHFVVPDNLKVVLLGNVPAEHLGHTISEAGAVVAPTLADEWLVVVNEALHAGVPVIGSVYAQAVTTLVRDGENGWQYDPLSSDSLGAVLDRYFGVEQAQMQRIRAAARRAVQTRTPQWAGEGALRAIRFLLAKPGLIGSGA